MTREQLGVLWGKSAAGDGSMHLLVGHLVDTAAVGELLWDRWMSPGTRATVDLSCRGRGRDVLSLLCGLHDLGKATPAFQMKVPELQRGVKEAGLPFTGISIHEAKNWHHALAGAAVLRSTLGLGIAFRWVWPLILGHHGVIGTGERIGKPPRAHGGDAWHAVQREVVDFVCTTTAVDLEVLRAADTPRRAVQLALAGAIVMADWIASSDAIGPGQHDLSSVTMAGSRTRADAAWSALGLQGGWAAASLVEDEHMMQRRFGAAPRPLQDLTMAAARAMRGPGLMIVEAPMGEGKTEAALLATEVLAARYGANGVFVAMPTQATGDAMFSRVRAWSGSIDPDLALGLLHGRRSFNREWMSLRRRASFNGICDQDNADAGDAFGMDDEYGAVPDDMRKQLDDHSAGTRPADWFLGRKQSLLVPVSVGTVDQLLLAATRTRHVMLRHLGLIGRIVVIDEVHAYDVYMSQFLLEELRWLGQASVPVVLLSATLPPAQRDALLLAYAEGAAGRIDVELPAQEEAGYPTVTTLAAHDGVVAVGSHTCEPWRASLPVRVDVLEQDEDFTPAATVASLSELLAEGGCALVVMNTVNRAQQAYLALRDRFGGDVVLLHSRLTVTERGRRTEQLLDELGPPTAQRRRPHRRIIVATQVAEQSFDVDVDILVSDLAPIDLLLQRIGRLHRHERTEPRPEPVRQPIALITGVSLHGTTPPSVPDGSEYVYGMQALLRAAALVQAAAGGKWSVPAAVPDLVRRGYDQHQPMPPGWEEARKQAAFDQDVRDSTRVRNAEPFLLLADHNPGASLVGLQERGVHAEGDAQHAVVRDGDPSGEVILVRRRADGRYLTLGGRDLGVGGEAISEPDILEEVAGSLVRLPSSAGLAAAAEQLGSLPAWTQEPWLRDSHVLTLDDSWASTMSVGRDSTTIVQYDTELGLTTARMERR